MTEVNYIEYMNDNYRTVCNKGRYATSRKVAGSIPQEAISFFN
jgi:hypothetical protein